MTQDEHDAKCWRAMKRAVSETIPKMKGEAREIALQVQSFLVSAEVCVDQEQSDE